MQIDLSGSVWGNSARLRRKHDDRGAPITSFCTLAHLHRKYDVGIVLVDFVVVIHLQMAVKVKGFRI